MYDYGNGTTSLSLLLCYASEPRSLFIPALLQRTSLMDVEPLVEAVFRIILLLEYLEARQTFVVDGLQTFVAMRKVDVSMRLSTYYLSKRMRGLTM
jgi:hypothetical protein